MNISTIMILAAGLGKRMKQYSKKIPKPLIKIGSETLIEKIIKKLEINGFRKIVINIFYLKNKIKKELSNKFKTKIYYSEEKILLNTGGGIKNAIKILKAKEFFVINSDIIWEEKTISPFDQLNKFWNEDKMDALLLLYPKKRNNGDYNINKSNRIVIEPLVSPNASPVNANRLAEMAENVSARRSATKGVTRITPSHLDNCAP